METRRRWIALKEVRDPVSCDPSHKSGISLTNNDDCREYVIGSVDFGEMLAFWLTTLDE